MEKILTLDNLYEFFVKQNTNVSFSAEENKGPIVVNVLGNFSSNDDEGTPGMLKLSLKVCHILENRNGSYISKENMENAMPTLKYRPILAHIHELEDGTKDFSAHNVEMVESESGEMTINYIEKQVGCFTADDPWLEYDKDMDKTYVRAYAVIPEEYTDAADIIRRKNGTKVSCELCINSLEYNAKEKYLDIVDFYFSGCTLLGCDEDGNEIGEGMLGSRADIGDFCRKEPIITYQNKMIEVLEKLNNTLSNFNTNIQKGGNVEMNIFETLLEKYGKTVEDVTFDVEGLSDEELEAKFKEVFEASDGDNATDDTAENDGSDDNSDGETGGSDDDTSDDADNNDGVDGTDGDVDEPEKFTKTFTIELSHEDVRYALYNLIGVYEEEDNEWYSIRSVYDNYFYMQGWMNNKLYKVGYSVDGENIALEGERQEMFEIIVSESEKLAIDKMREDYSALEAKYNDLKEFKDNYDAAELKAKKDEIFARDEYSVLVDDEAFKTLISDAEKFSVSEIEAKAKAIFADHVIKAGVFSASSNEDNKKKPQVQTFSSGKEKEKKKKAYGKLFD